MLSLVVWEFVNVFGSVDMDVCDSVIGCSGLQMFVFGVQVIRGYGVVIDCVCILVDMLVWDGLLVVSQVLGSDVLVLLVDLMVDWFGVGQLDIVICQLQLGCVLFSCFSFEVFVNWQVFGFSVLNLSVLEQLLFFVQGMLDVFQQCGDYLVDKGWQYSGGSLGIDILLLIVDFVVQLCVCIGGDFCLCGGIGKVGGDVLGSELSIDVIWIVLDSMIVLVLGWLFVNVCEGIMFGSWVVLDLVGCKVLLYDVDKFSWGGDVLLFSDMGDICIDVVFCIDVFVCNNCSGCMMVIVMVG